MAQKNEQSIRRKEKIGEGSFGVVYIGSYLQYKEVAIKDIKGYISDEALQEANLLKKLTHQNIIQCYDIVQTSNQISIIMEFIDGGDFFRYMQRTPQCTTYWQTTKKILSDVAFGMAYLHSQHIVHSDLKSINILLRHDYSALICDFGLARTIESQQSLLATSVSGTALWFAPELCFDLPERSSYSSDVWAYGCIILEVISRKYPWIENYPNSMVLLKALGNEENANIFANICLKQRAPKKLRALLCHCCSWHKRDRPKFADITRDLNAISDIDLEDINQGRGKSTSSTAPKKQTNQTREVSSVGIAVMERLERDYPRTTCVFNPVPVSSTDSITERYKLLRLQKRQSDDVSNKNERSTNEKKFERKIIKGPRGGAYYIRADGTKVYVQSEDS